MWCPRSKGNGFPINLHAKLEGESWLKLGVYYYIRQLNI